MANWHIAYCTQDITILMWLLLQVYVQQVLNYKKVNCHTEKEVCQHSHSSDPVLVHTIHTVHCNILPYAIYIYVEVSVLNCIALRCIAISPHIDIIIVTAL